MRYLLIADIHSNIDALSAVDNSLRNESIDEILVLGDLTGYGPNPVEVIDRIRAYPRCRTIRGNHDKIVSKTVAPLGFNSHAIVAAYKNMNMISGESLDWLKRLPEQISLTPQIRMVHGSLADPDEYILSLKSAKQVFTDMQRSGLKLVLFGHTHVPTLYEFNGSLDRYYDIDLIAEKKVQIDLGGDSIYLLNPGSIGQPRDGNPKASLALLDMKQTTVDIELRRVEYNIAACREKMIRDKYPEILYKRLEIGH